MNDSGNVQENGLISPRTSAMTAGIALLVMTILAPFAYMYVMPKLIVWDDAAATVSNLMASKTLFRLAIFSFLVVIIADIIVAWALYILFKPVSRELSLLAAWLRIIYAVIFAVALNELFGVLKVLEGSEYLKAISSTQIQAHVMLLLSAFETGWNIGYPFFGLHLCILGWLAFRSGYIPRFMCVLLAIAGAGYLADSIGKFITPNYNANIAAFTFVGELLLLFWLLWKGFRGFEKK